MPQKGQVLLRFESFAVHPAIISSSYTRQSHVLQSEQLDINTYKRKRQVQKETITLPERAYRQELDWDCYVLVPYLYGVIGSGLEAAGVGGGIWSVRSFGGKCQTTWIQWRIIQSDTERKAKTEHSCQSLKYLDETKKKCPAETKQQLLYLQFTLSAMSVCICAAGLVSLCLCLCARDCACTCTC